jgi:hypothetical protein
MNSVFNPQSLCFRHICITVPKMSLPKPSLFYRYRDRYRWGWLRGAVVEVLRWWSSRVGGGGGRDSEAVERGCAKISKGASLGREGGDLVVVGEDERWSPMTASLRSDGGDLVVVGEDEKRQLLPSWSSASGISGVWRERNGIGAERRSENTMDGHLCPRMVRFFLGPHG